MSLRYVLDEQLRGPLWNAILAHNGLGSYPIDVVRVGDVLDLPLGTDDPALLLWAEREGRLLITRDKSSMPGHVADHLYAGQHTPGVFIIRRHTTLRQVNSFLVAATYASDPAEWQDRIEYIG
jgi:hypothetical protein